MNDVCKRLTEAFAKGSWAISPPPVDLADPDWTSGGWVHNWKTHVPLPLIDVWEDLSDDARVVAYYMASEEASNEEWD